MISFVAVSGLNLKDRNQRNKHLKLLTIINTSTLSLPKTRKKSSINYIDNFPFLLQQMDLRPAEVHLPVVAKTDSYVLAGTVPLLQPIYSPFTSYANIIYQ
ncbi:hypothetical protein SPTER_44650 [Sporomusa termitida]|uniref:Uncharacterized protein n=1 Tax=Sporomusa termitida TaxID=2377 RepID=A0A517E082_9FIRM|nr:hypothetical protein SPTER_44650 [Sporomusa termitida]